MHVVKCVTVLISEYVYSIGVNQCSGLSTGDYLLIYLLCEYL